MTDIVLNFRCLDSAGALVLDCFEANGYEVVSLEPLERTWRRDVRSAPDVEDEVEVQSVLGASVYGAVIRCVGVSNAQAAARRRNLIAAVEQRRWRLEVTIGADVETFAARRADTQTTRDHADVLTFRRHVTLRIPVSPRPLEEV